MSPASVRQNKRTLQVTPILSIYLLRFNYSNHISAISEHNSIKHVNIYDHMTHQYCYRWQFGTS